MKKTLNIFLILLTQFLTAPAQSPEWYFMRPDKSGISGDYHEVIKTDCNNNIWTAGYIPFYSNGSVVRFNQSDTVFTCWGNYDGYLPADRVYDIDFDNNNGVWVATNGIGNGIAHGGISHYDGSTWTTYTTANSPMIGDDMRGITVDNNNTVWATFEDATTGGIVKFNGTTWTIYTPSNSNLQTTMVDKIVSDNQNNIWIGSNLGLIKFDGLNWILFSPANSGLTSFDVKDVEYDEATNKIYAVTNTSVDIFDGTTWTHINNSNSPVSANGLNCVDVSGDKIVVGVLASNSGCYIYDGTSWTTHNAPNHMYDVRIDNTGNFWTCGIGYLEKYDGAVWKTYTRYNTGLVDYINNQIFVDSKNRKWFANDEGGIQVFDCPQWEDYGKFNEGLFPSLQNNTPIGTSVTEDSYGDIWMTYYGGFGYAIQIPDGDYKNYASWILWDNTNTTTNFQTPEEVESDDSGHVFMRLYNSSVMKYNHANNSWSNLNSLNSGLPPSGLNCMTPRAGGKMYFGGFREIAVLDNGTWSYVDSSFLANGPIDYIYDIAFDHTDKMWLATNHGVYKYDGTTWTNWTEANSNIAANYVTSIEFGGGDTVFIGAHNTQTFPYYGGISIYNGTSWTSFLEGSSPIAHKQVEGLEMDKLGNLWIISQTEGVTIYKKGGVVGFECIDQSLKSCGTTGLSQPIVEENSKITCYPNPFSATATLSFKLETAAPVLMDIYDVTGRKIKSILLENPSIGQQHIIIEAKDFKNGIYICEIKTTTQSFKTKLIIQ
ncbi:MAG: T9SS type A sorting domain-containing protein [Bacteroidota bacterium]